jgi:hypothetical protein
MLIGYARISTDDQNLDLQRDALRQAGCKKICEDRISGSKAARPGLALALEVARAGDVLVVWRLDRLGRSLHDLIVLAKTLEDAGIGLMAGKYRHHDQRRSPGVLPVRRVGRVRAEPDPGADPGRPDRRPRPGPARGTAKDARCRQAEVGAAPLP